MNWPSAAAFFDMGGYGLYVWGAYALAGVVLLAEPWLAHRRLRQALHNAAAPPDQERP
jgi:heme exporter protein D